ncbi:MAG: acetyl-CoA C-acetyltransferase, partial [Pseudomonas stutzeri]|nr:acetyl-CoA C-acetyltransferase [Stutzerimonas stutzeri]
EECADTFGFTREEQDAFALESLRRAQVAISEGRFADEIVALEVTQGKQQRQIRDDEQPPKAMPEKIPT